MIRKKLRVNLACRECHREEEIVVTSEDVISIYQRCPKCKTPMMILQIVRITDDNGEKTEEILTKRDED